MERSELCSGKDYLDKFDPYAFLQEYFGPVLRNEHMFRCYHDAFQLLPSNITVLDYGSGPSVALTISAATKASDIILSDYSPTNREAARDWLEHKPDAFDWVPTFRYVVKDLERKGEDEVVKRQQSVRNLVRGIVDCDLTRDPPIEADYNQPFDVVVSSFVLKGVAKDYNEYCSSIARLTTLIKPGGCLMIYGVECGKGYTVANYTFKEFPVTSTMAIDAMKRCGFTNIHLDKVTTIKTYMFIKGTLQL